jgi:hypothetical protein
MAVVAVAGVAAGAIVVGALAITRDGERRASATSVPTEVTTPTAPPTTVASGLSIDQPAPLGAALSPAKNWTVKVTGVDLDGDATMARQGMFFRPGPGKQYVLVSLSATNEGTKPANLGEVKAELVTPDGAAHGSSWWLPTPRKLDPFTQVQPGGTTSGSLAFEVPKADVSRVVLMVEPMFSLTPGKDQRFLAVQ